MIDPSEIYVWFAQGRGGEGERFIRAWTDNPERIAGMHEVIGKPPTQFRAVEPTNVEDGQ